MITKKLLFAIMYPTAELLDKALSILQDEFGTIRAKSQEYDFSFTDYYEPEFGNNLKKTIFVFDKAIRKHDLIDIREDTGEIERQLSRQGKRQVNIDPGYISNSELVLTTKKAKPFKEHLGNGIYAHKVLEFKDGEIITFKHTFADYKIRSNLEFFRKLIGNIS